MNQRLLWPLLMLVACQQPTDGLLSPSQAINDFEVEEGYEVQCVAAEPAVQDPVAIAFDEAAQMWVVEMRGYMPNADGIGEDLPTGRIKVLADTNNDGVFDSVRVFLDSLVLPRAVCPVYGGVLVAVPPALWFYDLSGKQRELVDSAYADGGNVEHQPNGLLPAPDFWIYSAKSDRRYRRQNGKWEMQHTVFRGQWGISHDDAGRLVYNHNGGTLQADQVASDALPALASVLSPNVRKLFGQPIIDDKVWPRRATPAVNRGYQEGVLDSNQHLVHVTAACGPTVYRGDNLPCVGSAFVCEPAAQLVKRVELFEKDGTLQARHPYTGREFLTATDERFRPVSTATGPDGALYIVDMHRGVIQHSTYLTTYLRKQIEAKKLGNHTGMGRIYRVVKKGTKPFATSLVNKSSAELEALRNHSNGWVRDKVRWLIGHSDTTAIPMTLKSAEDFWGFLRKQYSGFLSRTDTKPNWITVASDSLVGAIFAGGVWEHAAPVQVSAIRKEIILAGAPKQSCLIEWLASKPVREKEIPTDLKHLTKAEREMYQEGRGNYENYCMSCHGKDGEGIDQIAPPLMSSEWVLSHDASIPIGIILDGKQGPITVNGKSYHFPAGMLGLRDNQTINDGTVAKILTFIRNSWGNKATAVHTDEVSKVRAGVPLKQTTARPIFNRISEVQPSRPTRTERKFKVKADTTKAYNPFDQTPPFGGTRGRILGGKANYQLHGDTLIGTTTVNTPNAFLVSDKAYSNFVLELDIWIDTALNSGIQIRSNSYPNYYEGVFHGYQIEVDPSPRAWSGGLYDESRRGWLFNLKDKPEAQKAFKRNDWNHYRIEAIGPHIRTWVNEIPVTDFVDSMTRSGYLGLQVHGIGNDSSKIGKEVRWRNIQLTDLGGPIWMAKEESQANPLYHVYDRNPLTSWQGEYLQVDFLDVKRREAFCIADEGVQYFISNDGKLWQAIDSHEHNQTFPACRLIQVRNRLGSHVVINEIRFWDY